MTGGAGARREAGRAGGRPPGGGAAHPQEGAGREGPRSPPPGEEEGPGKPPAGARQAGGGARLHEDEGERDRQARPALEHVVQKAVPRIVVVLLVAAEAALAEQVASERDRRPLGYPRGHDPLPRSFGESVELGEVRGGL